MFTFSPNPNLHFLQSIGSVPAAGSADGGGSGSYNAAIALVWRTLSIGCVDVAAAAAAVTIATAASAKAVVVGASLHPSPLHCTVRSER